MSGFFGRYDFQMDEKGRVSLPSAFRKGAEGERFVLLQWQKPHLTLFPEKVWAEVEQRLLEFRRKDPAAGTYVRKIASNAVEVVPDKQGRILIPAWLQEAAGLQGAVLLNGNIDRVEIWNPEAFRKSEAEGEADGDSARFSHQIFS